MATRLNLKLLDHARYARRALLSSSNPLCNQSSVRDAVHLAADGLRSEADERRYEARENRQIERELDSMGAQA